MADKFNKYGLPKVNRITIPMCNGNHIQIRPSEDKISIQLEKHHILDSMTYEQAEVLRNTLTFMIDNRSLFDRHTFKDEYSAKAHTDAEDATEHDPKFDK